MGAAKKQEEQPILDPVDQPTDRELKLAKNFEDPALDELLQPENVIPLNVADEAVAAVEELVAEVSPDDLPEDLPLPEPVPIMQAPLRPPPVKSAAPASAPAPQHFDHAPLPKTVNPNPDPLEQQSRLISKVSAGLDVSNLAGAPKREPDLFKMCDTLIGLVACERSFDEVVKEGLVAIMGAVNAYTGSVLELDHQHEDFFFRASFGGTASHTKLKTFRVPLTKGIVGHVAETGQPLLIRNLAEDEKQMRAISLSVGFEAVSCMAAPILVGGEPYGVIEVFNKADGSLYDDRDLAILEDGVRMLAKVLEVRFLLAELARRIG